MPLLTRSRDDRRADGSQSTAKFGTATLVVSVALSGCGGGQSGDVAQDTPQGVGSSAATSTGAAGAAATPRTFNSVDVIFAQGMIPHHRQAADVAGLAGSRTTNKQVAAIAAAIRGIQGPEIKQMTAWLKAWGKPLPSTKVGEAHEEAETQDETHSDDHGDDHAAGGEEQAPHGHEGQGGLLTAAQIARLKKLEGRPFDRQFLTLMVGHHTGAVRSANQTIALGLNSDVKKLCRTIVKARATEIKQMKRLLKAI